MATSAMSKKAWSGSPDTGVVVAHFHATDGDDRARRVWSCGNSAAVTSRCVGRFVADYSSGTEAAFGGAMVRFRPAFVLLWSVSVPLLVGGCAGEYGKVKGRVLVLDSDGSTTPVTLTEENTSVYACFGPTCSGHSLLIATRSTAPTATSLDLYHAGIPRVGSAPLAAEQLKVCLSEASQGDRCIYAQGTLAVAKSETSCDAQCCVLDMVADLALLSDGSLRPAYRKTYSTTTSTPAVPFNLSGSLHIEVHESSPADDFSDEGYFTPSC